MKFSKIIFGINVIALAGVLLLAACGDDDEPTPQNTLTANAGTDLTAEVGELVSLDGSGSSDSNGNSFSYSWAISSRPSGSTVSLSSANTATPSLTPDVAGDYTITLTISNSDFDSSDDVVVTAIDPTLSLTADAGADEEAFVGFEVSADGSGSTSSGAITYSWEITDAPTGSTAALDDASVAIPELIPDLPGEYELTLTVSTEGLTDTDVMMITAIAKRVFVDAVNGTDGNLDGYLPESPVKSFNRALQIAALNETDAFHEVDTLRVAEGLYNETNGEVYPIEFQANLHVLGDEMSDRNNIHLLSPDVDREPAVILNEGNVFSHLHIENGYLGDDPSGDPDVVYVNNGTALATSLVELEDVTISTNNPGGFMLTAGSDISVEVLGATGSKSLFDAKGIGSAYGTRFNTSNTSVSFENTDFINMGTENTNGAFEVGNTSSNHSVSVSSGVIRPGANVVQPGSAFDVADGGNTLTIDDVTVTSSDGTTTGNRFRSALNMANSQSNTSITIANSTLQYTYNSALLIRLSTFEVDNTIIEGVNTQDPGDITYLSEAAVEIIDGTVTLRGNTIRDINANGILIIGLAGNTVDFGTANSSGNNIFQSIEGFDIYDSRDASSDFVGELPAIGNTWSNSASPRCTTSSQNPETAEIFIDDTGNSIRWGTGTGEVCSN